MKGINKIRTATSHFFPILILIALFEIIAIQIYLHSPLSESLVRFFLWISAQAVGGVVLGYISDHLCRKKTLIGIQIGGIVFLSLILWKGYSSWAICLLGLVFNPSPVARAAMVDNFPTQSKVKLIAITFIAQFIPWCFYFQLSRINSNNLVLYATSLLFLNLFFTWFLFSDHRDAIKKTHEVFLTYKKIHKKGGRRILFTLEAFLMAQLIFFLSDSFFEKTAFNASIFSALGMGSFIGTIISLLYRKIPHLSLLTICYGIGFLLSIIPFLSSTLLTISDVNINYQLMLFSSLGGFYLPFVYDVILSATSGYFRGTACGIIEGVLSISAVLGVIVTLVFKPTENTILLITALLFLGAAFIQRKGEKIAK